MIGGYAYTDQMLERQNNIKATQHTTLDTSKIVISHVRKRSPKTDEKSEISNIPVFEYGKVKVGLFQVF